MYVPTTIIYSEVSQESGVVSEYSSVTIYPDNLKFRIHQSVILLDWRQYGVDGWIQFALAVDPLI